MTAENSPSFLRPARAPDEVSGLVPDAAVGSAPMPAPPGGSAVGATGLVARWRRRLDTLRVKLFLAIAGANVVLVMAAYLVYGWSFDQGLVEYLNRADETRLVPLINRLAQGWRDEGGWRWVADDRHRWNDLLRDSGLARPPRREPDGPPAASVASARDAAERGVAATPPATAAAEAPAATPASGDAPAAFSTAPGPVGAGPRGGGGADAEPHRGARPAGAEATEASPQLPPPLTIDPRLLLLDAEHAVLIGNPERVALAVLKPIAVDGATVGYLGYLPRLQVLESLERVFAVQQNRRFAAIAIGLLAAVLLNAALIAAWLGRRLAPLREGATALARGDYAMRLPAAGHDEVAQLAADFNRMAEALETAQRQRQRWIADIAHELRTPLATLRAEIEALQDGVRPLSQAGVASLGQEVGRLSRLVEDLRLLSLSDLGALTVRREPVDLAELVEDDLRELIGGDRAAARPEASASGLALRLDLRPGVVVDADADRLAQVFGNLLQNTLRYTEAPARLAVTLRAEGEAAHLVWEDSAPGVAEADLPRLTDRLFRVDGSRARASGGSGLGLAIVKAIVEVHGGRLAASASPLGGLRWDLWLPLAGAPALTTPPASAAASGAAAEPPQAASSGDFGVAAAPSAPAARAAALDRHD